MFCNECGSELKEDQKFCTNCGSKLDQTQPQFRQSSAPAERASTGTAAAPNLQPLPSGTQATIPERTIVRVAATKGNKLLVLWIILAVLVALGISGSLFHILRRHTNKDDFSAEKALDPSRWQASTPLLTTLAEAQGSRYVQPQLSFDHLGMRMAGVNGTYEFTGVQSTYSLLPPFTIRVKVMGTISHGNTFALYLLGNDSGQSLAIEGNLNPQSGYQGLSIGSVKVLRDVGTDQWYTIVVAVDAMGSATVTFNDSRDTILASKAGLQLGRGPFVVVLGQREGAPFTVGPNEAVWSFAEVTSRSNLVASSSKENTVSDADIVSNIKAKLAGDPNLSNLQVQADHGIVTLSGAVNSDADKTKVTGLAAQVPGVTQVQIYGVTVGGAEQRTSAIAPGTNGGIRSIDFHNFTYQPTCEGFPNSIHVTNGHWKNGASEVADSLSFSVVQVAYGDVKGDGKEEAVVHIACYPPANFHYEELFVFEMAGASPKLLVRLTPGEDLAMHGPGYEIVKTGGGEMDVSYQANGEHGYGACPEWTVTERLHWSGNRFVNAGESRKKNSCALSDAAQDVQTANAVQARINADRTLSRYHLSVTCGGGVVTLTGSVNSDAEKRKAAALAAHVKNVVSVNTSGVVVNGEAGGGGNIQATGNQPTISLQANPASITPGQQVTLTWQSTNATSVSINGMPEPPTGSQAFTPTQPITYQAVATSSSGQTASAVAVIIVKQPLAVTLSAGTPIRVRMNDSLDSGKVSSGTTFRAILDQNLMAGGDIVALAGAEVNGRVVVAKKAGILGGNSELALELSQIHIKEQLQPITTNRFDSSAPGGGGGGAQLVAGEIAVNDTLYSVGADGITTTKLTNLENTLDQWKKFLTKKSVVIRSGAVLQFSLQQPVTVTLPPR